METEAILSQLEPPYRLVGLLLYGCALRQAATWPPAANTRGGPEHPTSNIQHRTLNIEPEGEGSAMRAGGKKCYGSPANKGDFVINTGYSPGHHRGVAGKTPLARAERTRRSRGWNGLDKCG
ncbi:MAG: hypothetical protein ACLQU3_05705 [Limisphaerales bacterium]